MARAETAVRRRTTTLLQSRGDHAASGRSGPGFRTGLARLALLAGAALTVLAGGASAQDFPRRAVKIVVAFAAGGAGDTTARLVGEKMAEDLGQPVVVENRVGAGGIVGAQVVAHAAADGYTMLLAANSFVINSVLREKPSYDAVKDFAPVAMLAKSPMLLTVHPSLGVKSFSEFVALAKAQPGRIRFAAAGPGAAPHIASEIMKSELNLDMLYVPYPGETPGLMATASGVVDATFMNYSGVASMLGSGKVDVITAMSAKRVEMMKDIPTVAESGGPSFDFNSWYALLAPAGTPPAAIARLNAAANRALQAPELRAKLTALGLAPEGGTSAELGSTVQSEKDSYAAIIKKLNLKVD